MKRILAIIIALMIILTGCSKAKSDGQDIGNRVTDDQIIENASDTEETQDDENSNVTTNNNNSTKQTNKSSDEQGMQQDNDTNKEINNQYFFKNIVAKKQYTYKGTIWGDYVVEGDKSEKTNDEGEVYVVAKVSISEIAKLNKGGVFEFDFSIYGEENNTEERGKKAYYWVTEDKIYQLSLPVGFDTKKFVDNNGNVDYLSCAKALELSGQLPREDEDLIRCSNNSISLFKDKDRPQEIEIKNDICKYSFYNSRNSSFENLEWKIGKGLTHYAQGYGAKREGMRLDLVE